MSRYRQQERSYGVLGKFEQEKKQSGSSGVNQNVNYIMVFCLCRGWCRRWDVSVRSVHRWPLEAGGIPWSHTHTHTQTACQGTMLCTCVCPSVSIGHLPGASPRWVWANAAIYCCSPWLVTVEVKWRQSIIFLKIIMHRDNKRAQIFIGMPITWPHCSYWKQTNQW